MATSGSVSTTKYEGRYLTLSWTATQSIANNTSTIKWTLKGDGSATSSWYYAGPFKVVIAGSTVYSSSTRIQLYDGTTVASGTKTITHNSDGSKSVTMKVEAAIYSTSVNCTGSKTFTLTDIPRKATISSAPNFTSADNPTISYSNPAGSSVTTLQAAISLTGATDDIAYRDISKTGSSYTFELTDDERDVLRNATTTSNSRTVRFYIKTIIGGETYYSYSTKTFTIANTTVGFAPSIYDANSTTTALTGDNNTLIKYYSTAYARSGATAYEGATIASQSITNGSKTVNDSYAIFTNVESNGFIFNATDSRGNSRTVTVGKTMVDYVKLTCNGGGDPPTADGNFTFKVTGNYFNGSFGAVTNTLTVKYRYKVEGGTWSSYQTLSPTISGNTYSAEVTLSGLDYQTTYVFDAYAVDQLATVYSAELKTKSEPVFDWSATDFNLNVPFNMNDKTVLREADAYNHTVLSANGGSIYLRPNGTDDTAGEARLYPSGDLKLSGQLTSGTVAATTLSATSAAIEGDLTVSGSINCNHIGADLYSGTSYLSSTGKMASGGSHTARFYVLKPFNMVFMQIYINGLTAAVTASTSYATFCTVNSDLAPAYYSALSISSIKECAGLINTSGEVRISPRGGFTTGNDIYISAFYKLNSSSPYYCA
ncbi:MAG: hypothetical protein ACI3T9_01370 [Romboutsia timonensis]